MCDNRFGRRGFGMRHDHYGRHFGPQREFRVPVNIVRNDDSYEMLIFAPDRNKEDFKINVQGLELTISFPGLVRYDEVVEQGEIRHALRFTARATQRGFIHPATHFASTSTDATRPPMGLRMRMKASYDCSTYSFEAQVVCTALKRYGMFVADNGSDWYLTGAHDPRWDDDALSDLKRIPGGAFEAVYTGEIIR